MIIVLPQFWLPNGYALALILCELVLCAVVPLPLLYVAHRLKKR